MTHACDSWRSRVKQKLLVRALQAVEPRRVDAVCQVYAHRPHRRPVANAETSGVHHVVEVFEVVLVRPETSPDDVHGMIVAEGILTARGGATSHAAVVARSIGKPCVAGTETVRIDLVRRMFSSDGVTVSGPATQD